MKVSQLKNGISLITVPLKGTKAITVLAMFPVGARYEDAPISGVSHFVEHMMFKGTQKFPAAFDISRTLDAVGAHYNAFTNKEYTGYYIKIAGDKQALAFEVLSDILFHSEFKEEEVEKEKGAIVEERRMYKDNPSMEIEELFDELLFPKNPLGWEVVGSEETIRGISRAQLWDYYQRHYSPKSMVLVVSGDVRPEKMKVLRTYFEAKVSPAKAVPFSYYKKKFVPFVWTYKLPLEKRVIAKQKTVDQAQLLLGFPGFKHGSKERFAVALLAVILGGGMSSRLFMEVREKRGLAYMVRSGTSSYRDVGYFYVQAGLDPARLPEAVQVIKEQLLRLVKEGVTDKELADAKNNVAGGMALQMEDSYHQASWYADKFIFSPRLETPEQIVRTIRKVTARQVQQVAARLFDFNEVRVATISSLAPEQCLDLWR